MQATQLTELLERQKQFFATGRTRSVEFRIAQLKKLRDTLKAREDDMLKALKKDLGKAPFEAYGSEVGFVYEELSHTLKHINGWTKRERVATPLLHQPASSYIYPQPKGMILVIGPWNYPIQLMMSPLIGAIAAGNTVVLKPSEVAPACAQIIQSIVESTFSPDYCAVVMGGVPETTELLKQRFDHIFFTGSIPVGRVVMRAAAEHLTPVTLELGGKSPCIIDEDTDLDVTVRRVVWGKYFNAGQTCIAPDYLLVPKALKRDLIARMKAQITQFFGVDPAQSPDYSRIINKRHLDRLTDLLKGADLAVGGESNPESLYLAPTIVDNVKLGDPLMQDEIFGPIMPIIEYENLEDALNIVRERPHPLACYVFTNRSSVEERVISELAFGGGCVNNTLVHIANANLPFGGFGPSGLGAYHGKSGFDTFSHKKAILKSAFMFDVKIKYPPYGKRLSLLRKLMR